MENQYFIFKLKDDFLPEVIKEYQRRKILKQFSWSDIYFLDKKYFRKLKIQNIEERISEEEKSLLEFLINESFTKILNNSEIEGLSKRYNSYSSSSSGASGYSGTGGSVGVSGVSGMSGYGGMGVSGSGGWTNGSWTTGSWTTTHTTLPFVTV